MLRLCFVCLGNICRSPTAEAVMFSRVERRGLAQAIAIESAGTAGYHIGARADSRSIAAGRRRGYEFSTRAQQFLAKDFARFDYVIAMDKQNRDDLLELAHTDAERSKVYLLRDFAEPGAGLSVPDPYYGQADGFETVLDICEQGCDALLDWLVERHRALPPP